MMVLNHIGTGVVCGILGFGLAMLANIDNRAPWDPLPDGEKAPLVVDCPQATGKPDLNMVVQGAGFSPNLDNKTFGMHIILDPEFDPVAKKIPDSIEIDVNKPDTDYPLGCFVRIANQRDLHHTPKG